MAWHRIDKTTWRLDGELTIYEVEGLYAAWREALADGDAPGTLDLAGLARLDGAGAQLLAMLRKARREAGGDLALLYPPDHPLAPRLAYAGLSLQEC